MTFSAPCSVYFRIFLKPFRDSSVGLDSRAWRRKSGELLLLRFLPGDDANSAADCVRDTLFKSPPLTEASEEPGEPTEFIDGCDFNEVVPLACGVDITGVNRAPLLDAEMVAGGCCIESGGLLNLLEPAEYVAAGDFGFKKVLGFLKLNPPPRTRFRSEGVGEAVPVTSPNSDSDPCVPVVLEKFLSVGGALGTLALLDVLLLRNTLRR